MGVNEGTVGAGAPEAEPRVTAAASALAQAVRSLRTIRRNALGGNYDQATFDHAVRECRLAETAVGAARQALDAARAAARLSGGAALPALPPARPTRTRPAHRPTPALVGER
jgi:hypothetical protein